MKRAAIAATILGLILPMSASASECQVLRLDNTMYEDIGTRFWHRIVVQEAEPEGSVKTTINGNFLWFGPTPDEALSVEIPDDAVGAVACPDGTITFEHATVEAQPTPTPDETGEDTEVIPPPAPPSSAVNIFDIYPDLYGQLFGGIEPPS